MLIAVPALGGCSGSSKEDEHVIPALPPKVCWRAFDGASVVSLLPKAKDPNAEVKGDPVFDLYGRFKSAGCQIHIDGESRFTAWGDRSWSDGRDLETHVLNSLTRLGPMPIEAGDKAIVYRGGARAYFRCERPDLPPSPRNVSSTEVKIVELGLSANSAPSTQHAKDVLTTLMKQYVQFAKRELKCRN
ncbi:hypothetical protein [Streptomyces sp. WM6378]|uniref:hypothetical protein n=1 Tax=Streptomyces sp. WM6378 TaxID=1415557 RepID=UPI00131ADB23|nr:hypothetical protein [Streptomyces sp. WM6378]